jgi:adenosylmethionine-8-amino-7-oxononanoate aminotransferase
MSSELARRLSCRRKTSRDLLRRDARRDNPARKINSRVKHEAMSRGLMVYPASGTADGHRGDHVLLTPPFIVDEAAIDTIVKRLGDAVVGAQPSVVSSLLERLDPSS